MPRTMQTVRKSADGPPPRKRCASSYNTSERERTITFNIGSTVIIQNSTPEFNGQVGIIKAYTVELLSNKKLVSARLMNIKTVESDVVSLLESKDKEIALLKESLKDNAREIARLEDNLTSKDKEIAALDSMSLESNTSDTTTSNNGEDESTPRGWDFRGSLRGILENNHSNSDTVRSIIYLHGNNISKYKMERIKAILHDLEEDVVDLTTDDEPASKRQRTGNPLKSNLAIQHEQNQKIVQVKEEKIAAETALEDVREDLEDSQEDMGRQVLFTDFLQSKIDELAALAEVGGVDRAKVAEIKSRSYSSMSS